MKNDFKYLKEIHIGCPLFLYGNLQRTFGAFCNFVFDKVGNIERHFCSVAEALKIANGQCELLGERKICFCIQGVEDNHLEKLQPILYDPNYLFVMSSGHYAKAKKVTQYFVNDAKSIALPSFKNDAALNSFCRMIIPGLSAQLYTQLVGLINKTDEDLASFFKKLQLLLDKDNQLLNEYVTYRSSYLDNISSIGLIRYFLQIAIREKYSEKDLDTLKKVSDTTINDLILCEIKIKLGENIPKSLIESHGNRKKPIVFSPMSYSI